MKAIRCRYCPQLLLTPESRARGYGPVCARKNGLPLTPTSWRTRQARPATSTTAIPVHPDQTTIPIQPTLPKEN
ncbi:DUF6011 domain-containing protein [Streptomyces sp. CA-288835]|uniref:DUF6011 domain-containing protein n=1 Tax=Streptomyces sp. CA-288835 TaxID=3240069 RepID=UPI003D91D7A9